ncbi:MAG: TetR/AcrR family transcriptional regulator C-terminal domain-containing protein [Erysipelotrichaceae bacterium]
MHNEEISLGTKRKLARELKGLMKKKPFAKITVSELIKNCKINRKTFYYHFDDIYDLLKWTFEEEAVAVVKNYNLMCDSKEVINFVLDYCEENRYFLINACDSVGRDSFKRFFYNDLYDIGISIISEAERVSGKSVDEKYRKFLCSFYVEAISGILYNWIKSDMKEFTRAEVVNYISSAIVNSLKGIMDKY